MGVLKELRFFVEPVIFITSLTMSMDISVVQQLIRRKICIGEGFEDCEGEAIVDLINLASPWYGAHTITTGLVLFSIGLRFGSWVDKYGRKRMMLVPFVGNILSTLIYLVASIYMDSTPLILIISAVVYGLGSGVLGVGVTCFSLMSSAISKDGWSFRIAILDSMTFVGSAVGFNMVGVILPKTSFATVFTFELCLHFIGLLYVLGVIEEPTDDLEQHKIASSHSPISRKNLASMLHAVIRPREGQLRSVVILLTLSLFLSNFGMAAATQLAFTRLTSPPFSWSPSEYSSYHGLWVLLQGASLVIGLPLSLRFLRIKDTTSALVGASSRLLGLTGLAVAYQDWMLFVTLALFSAAEWLTPPLRSILSKIVGSQERSQIFALLGVQIALGNVLTAVILLIPNSLTFLFPGFGMAIGAVAQVLPLLSLIYIRLWLKIDDSSRAQQMENPTIYGSISPPEHLEEALQPE